MGNKVPTPHAGPKEPPRSLKPWSLLLYHELRSLLHLKLSPWTTEQLFLQVLHQTRRLHLLQALSLSQRNNTPSHPENNQSTSTPWRPQIYLLILKATIWGSILPTFTKVKMLHLEISSALKVYNKYSQHVGKNLAKSLSYMLYAKKLLFDMKVKAQRCS